MRCVYPNRAGRCPNSARTRGLCHAHYQTMRAWVRAGKADEDDLVRRKLLMPAGEGSSPVPEHDAFRKGSTRKGFA